MEKSLIFRNRAGIHLGLTALFVVSLIFSGCAGSKSRLKVGETAEGEVVEAEGLAAMTDDLIAVKRAALSDAYKNAVEKVVGIFISARTMVDKAITIEQKVLGKTAGYVKKHDILKEGKGSDGLYHTKIRALVSFKQIENDLKGLDLLKSPSVGNPRVAILLDEAIEGSQEQDNACSDGLAQGLLEQGYQVVDRSELAAIRVAEATKDLLSGNTEKALKPIMQKLNAEVVITGKARGSLLTARGLGGLISYRGSLSAKALMAQTGVVLSAVTVQGSGLDATKNAAAAKAMTVLGRNAAKEFGSKIAAELSRRSSVLVTIRGLPNINLLSEVKQTLSGAAGVGNLYMRSFSNGTAEIEVRTKSATSTDLANAINSRPALKAKVVAQTQDSLELEVQ